MTWLVDLRKDHGKPPFPEELLGGKGAALGNLGAAGFAVPQAFCLTTRAYEEYLRTSGLRERIGLELQRKDFTTMRWEEMWDASLRIRNLFTRHPLPESITREIAALLEGPLQGQFAAVRSSAPGEDSSSASFAGLHESYVHLKGLEEICRGVRLVWASLWSDAALLYRQELHLDPRTSAMAVVIQEMAPGERSGILFTQSPHDREIAALEAVYGLNQGLVDGSIPPDRWFIFRNSCTLKEHQPVERNSCIRPLSQGGVREDPLSEEERRKPPLEEDEVLWVTRTGMELESLQGAPQDVEWTLRGTELLLLQARPVTTLKDENSQRTWHLGLRRSFDNLRELRRRVEEEILPHMEEEARSLEALDLETLSSPELAQAATHRKERYAHWKKIYWDECIPLAHGVRLFGQVYNDRCSPGDPFEFLGLLQGESLQGAERNARLQNMARELRENPPLAQALKENADPLPDKDFAQNLEEYLQRYGSLGESLAGQTLTREMLVPFLLRLAKQSHKEEDSPRKQEVSRKELEALYFQAFPPEEQEKARQILDLGRASYRLRDDDNLYLERFSTQVTLSLEEIQRRLGGSPEHKDILELLLEQEEETSETSATHSGPTQRPRQIRGQPAGRGLYTGRVRVLRSAKDIPNFQEGEILVCDAVDPNMTFLIPLAGAIVERRGGMLIHGAIIAREYGIPCVTGVPKAAEVLSTGDRLTVDGYTGIVTLQNA